MLRGEHFLAVPVSFQSSCCQTPQNPRKTLPPISAFGDWFLQKALLCRDPQYLKERALYTSTAQSPLHISNGAGKIHDRAAAILLWRAVTPTCCHRLTGEEWTW